VSARACNASPRAQCPLHCSVVSLSEPSLSAAARSESASEHPLLIEPPPAPPPAPRKTLAEINVPVNPPREPSPWSAPHDTYSIRDDWSPKW
jgi:hypothetical protein